MALSVTPDLRCLLDTAEGNSQARLPHLVHPQPSLPPAQQLSRGGPLLHSLLASPALHLTPCPALCTCCSMASLSMSAWLRLLMSSLVHAK
jgi:hypothetical protein